MFSCRAGARRPLFEYIKHSMFWIIP
jgi:hypothetical protein